MIPWYIVVGFMLNAALAVMHVRLRLTGFALFHGILAAVFGGALLLALDSWWECRDDRPAVATSMPDGTMRIDRLCPGQSVDAVVDLRTGVIRTR